MSEPSKLMLRYDIGVRDGIIEMKLKAPSGNYWNRPFIKSEKGSEEMMLNESGWYEMIFIGEDAEGSYPGTSHLTE